MPPLARVWSEGRVELTDAGRRWRGTGLKARVVALLAEVGPMGVRELAGALNRREDGGTRDITWLPAGEPIEMPTLILKQPGTF